MIPEKREILPLRALPRRASRQYLVDTWGELDHEIERTSGWLMMWLLGSRFSSLNGESVLINEAVNPPSREGRLRTLCEKTRY